MADSLYLSLWFRDSELEDLLPHGLRAMQQFLYSKGLPGVAGLSIHPVSWNEATILEQRYRPGIKPEEAVLVASDLLHEDYGYVFEANWDLWTPESGEGEWHKRPTPVKFIARAQDFEEGEAGTQGEIQVDFGLDTPFLHEELRLTSELESRVRANVQVLVDYISRVEKNVGAETRLLWSESDENLAQKLISRLQRVQ
ncbi:MAG TPA: hypothetical protein VN708_08325 [Terriglobales bacterium]|jgi:hypothetical protein|nr:hypothetical protein [Terriglobales bacterium]